MAFPGLALDDFAGIQQVFDGVARRTPIRREENHNLLFLPLSLLDLCLPELDERGTPCSMNPGRLLALGLGIDRREARGEW